MMSARCPIARFETALVRSATRAGAPLTIDDHHACCWQSATFAGHRHIVEAHAATGGPLDQWLASIADVDLTLPGQLLADLRVTERHGDALITRFTLNALTVAEG